MRKYVLMLCLVLFLAVNLLVFTACGQPQDEESVEGETLMEFAGEGEYWNVEFIIKEDDLNIAVVKISANYLGDLSEIEEVDTISYNFKWLHEDAEYIEGEDSVEFYGEDADSTIHMTRIASALTRDEENTFSGEAFISNPEDSTLGDIKLNELADYIRINLEWNEQEEVFEIERLN